MLYRKRRSAIRPRQRSLFHVSLPEPRTAQQTTASPWHRPSKPESRPMAKRRGVIAPLITRAKQLVPLLTALTVLVQQVIALVKALKS